MPRFILLLVPFLAVLARGATDAAGAPASLGAAYIAKGDAESAIAAYEKAVELEPGSSELHRRLGEAYGLAAQKAGTFTRLGWARKMRAAYEKAVELDPANLDARSGLMGFYQMAPGVMGGGLDKAYAQAAEIKRLDAVRGRIAYALLCIGEKKYADARTEIDEALRLEPQNYAALFQTGRLAALTGDQPDRGLAALQRCLALTPPSGAPGHEAAHWRLGNIHERKGDKAAARAAYQASLRINPQFTQAVESLAKLPE